MSDALKPVAKAAAAFLAPIILALIAALGERIGIELPVDVGVVETLIVSAISAAAVYFTRNRQAAE
jgi:hypothetical protein